MSSYNLDYSKREKKKDHIEELVEELKGKTDIKVEPYELIGGPVYEEPYPGFFESIGFKEKAYNFCHTYCSVEDVYGYRIEVNSSRNPILPVDPYAQIIANKVIYYEHTRGFWLELSGCSFTDGCSTSSPDKANEKAGRLEGKKAHRMTRLYKIAEMEDYGQDSEKIIESMVKPLAKYGCRAYVGYVLKIDTPWSTQTVVLEEDFKDSKRKYETLLEHSIKTISDVYSKDFFRLDFAAKRLGLFPNETALYAKMNHYCKKNGLILNESRIGLDVRVDKILESLSNIF